MENKTIIGQLRICKTFEMGKEFLHVLIDAGAPVKKIKGRYITHKDEFDSFVKDFVTKKAT